MSKEPDSWRHLQHNKPTPKCNFDDSEAYIKSTILSQTTEKKAKGWRWEKKKEVWGTSRKNGLIFLHTWLSNWMTFSFISSLLFHTLPPISPSSFHAFSFLSSSAFISLLLLPIPTLTYASLSILKIRRSLHLRLVLNFLFPFPFAWFTWIQIRVREKKNSLLVYDWIKNETWKKRESC